MDLAHGEVSGGRDYGDRCEAVPKIAKDELAPLIASAPKGGLITLLRILRRCRPRYGFSLEIGRSRAGARLSSRSVGLVRAHLGRRRVRGACRRLRRGSAMRAVGDHTRLFLLVADKRNIPLTLCVREVAAKRRFHVIGKFPVSHGGQANAIPIAKPLRLACQIGAVSAVIAELVGEAGPGFDEFGAVDIGGLTDCVIHLSRGFAEGGVSHDWQAHPIDGNIRALQLLDELLGFLCVGFFPFRGAGLRASSAGPYRGAIVYAKHDNGDVNGRSGDHAVDLAIEVDLLRPNQAVVRTRHICDFERAFLFECFLQPFSQAWAEPVSDDADLIAIGLRKRRDVAGG